MGIFLGFDAPPDREACGADTAELEHMAWTASQGGPIAVSPGGGASAFRAPGYPLMLAGLYRVFGRQYWVNRLLLSFMGAATCWLTFVLARGLGLSRPGALLAAAAVAALPLQFYYAGHFMSEVPATFFSVACTIGLVYALRRLEHESAGTLGSPQVRPPGVVASELKYAHGGRGCAESHQGSGAMASAWLFLGAGLLGGIAALVRAAGVLLGPAFGLLLLAARRHRFRTVVLAVGLFGVGMVAVIVPWTVRNYRVFDRFCLVTTNGGSTFWGTNNEVVADPGSEKWGYWVTTNFDPETKEREVWIHDNEVDHDRAEWRLGRRFLMQNPGKIPVLIVGKLWNLVSPFPKSNNRIYRLVVAAGQFVLLPFFVFGLGWVLAKKEWRRQFMPLFAQLLALLGTAVIFYGNERFRSAYEPFMVIIAIVPFDGLLKRGMRDER